MNNSMKIHMESEHITLNNWEIVYSVWIIVYVLNKQRLFNSALSSIVLCSSQFFHVKNVKTKIQWKNIKMHKKLLFSAYCTNITWDIGLFPLICWCTYTDILAAFLKMEDDTQYVKNMYRFRSLFSSQLIHVKNMENISISLVLNCDITYKYNLDM